MKISKKNLAFLIFMLLLAIIFIKLGFWQLERLNEKKIITAELQLNLLKPAVPFKSDDETLLNKKLLVKGENYPDFRIFLYSGGRINNYGDGYFLVNIIKTTDGKNYLVNRGWVSKSKKNKEFNFNKESEFEAFLIPLENKTKYAYENDIKNNIWFWLDKNTIEKISGILLEEFYFLRMDDSNSTDPIRGAREPYKLNNKHLEYLVTWFGFAVITFLMIICYFVKLIREQKKSLLREGNQSKR